MDEKCLMVQRANPNRRLEIGVAPTWRRTSCNLIFCVPYSYGILEIMVVVNINRAIAVLRPSEAVFLFRALNKN